MAIFDKLVNMYYQIEQLKSDWIDYIEKAKFKDRTKQIVENMNTLAFIEQPLIDFMHSGTVYVKIPPNLDF